MVCHFLFRPGRKHVLQVLLGIMETYIAIILHSK